MPQYDYDFSEISIEYDTIQKVFDIESNGIENISIDANMLKLDPNSTITINSNGNQVYKGMMVSPKMKLKLN